uniref:Small ribosomal subunit protein bS6c n=1 Tax=Ophidocladus simpliciusculus TaxID=1261574 RepID=A0A1Z1MIN5_9FLOR|nr:ribosomal protein S6 [Ophidocladus simpliciusculus]ARW65928.1 ribosomal protein S6 [Ophidocladus simpliciusculus]
MFLNNYEIIYILKPDVTDNVNLSLVNYYKSFLKEKGAKNIIVQHRGRRHLSYNIAHYYDGIYVQMNYQGNGELVKVLEKSMNFNDHIIRYLTVKQNIMNTINIY